MRPLGSGFGTRDSVSATRGSGRGTGDPMTLINERTGRTVADVVEVAVTRKTRRQGLLGRTGLAPFSALVLAPCAAVHTAFMRFAIDVVFVDRDGRALHVVSHLAPWRAAMSLFAHAVIEMPAGTLGIRDVAVGDALYLARGGKGRMSLRAADIREQLC